MSTLEDDTELFPEDDTETEYEDLSGTLADENEFGRICLYGRYGTGKTTAMAHAAKLGRLVHIDAEHRLKAGPLRRLGVPVNRIEPFRQINFDALEKLVWDVKGRLHDDPNSVAAMGFDGYDETTKLLVGHVLSENTEKLITRANRRGEVVDINPYAIDRDMWGEMTEQLRRLLRHMRDLPCHLVFTSHERRDLDEDTGAVTYGPAATPAAQADLMAYVDVIGHTGVDGNFYTASFAPGGRYQAKDTFGVLPKVLANPTVDRIVGYIQETLTEDTDPIQRAYLAYKEETMAKARESIVAGGGERRRRAKTPSA